MNTANPDQRPAAGADQAQPQRPATRQQDDASQERPKAAAPNKLFVLDTTAVAGKGNRVHEMMIDGVIRSYTFEPGKPLELDLPVAIKFLKHDEFKLADKDANLLPYHRRPKQPDELGAGEKFKIGDDETIAKYGELTNRALLQRALELPGGEAIRNMNDRQAMIDFITKIEIARREANKAKTPDIGKDDFVPVAELEEVA